MIQLKFRGYLNGVFKLKILWKIRWKARKLKRVIKRHIKNSSASRLIKKDRFVSCRLNKGDVIHIRVDRCGAKNVRK
mgnify:CR=1 FL=1